MSTTLEDFGFGKKWTQICTDSYEGYSPNMSDYHMHSYYEISLILSGNVHVLLSDTAHSGTYPRIVLLRPHTPHYMYCEPDLLYSRLNISFGADFLADCDPQWQKLLQVFPRNGSVLKLTEAICRQFADIFEKINCETDLFRKKLMLLYLLSFLSDAMPEPEISPQLPEFVTDTLSYISVHYSQHIVAADLAQRLGIGRTTLMTGFKKHTGLTVNEYLTRCRLKHAVNMLQSGKLEQEAAESCGFTDTCNLIRCFKRAFGMPPRQYLASLSTGSAVQNTTE